jgi:hypothetical protein
VGSTIVNLANHETLSAYASSSEALRKSEVDIENLEDEIEEAEESGQFLRAKQLRKRLCCWQQCSSTLEKLLEETVHSSQGKEENKKEDNSGFVMYSTDSNDVNVASD